MDLIKKSGLYYKNCTKGDVAICNWGIWEPKIPRYIEGCGDVTERVAIVVECNKSGPKSYNDKVIYINLEFHRAVRNLLDGIMNWYIGKERWRRR